MKFTFFIVLIYCVFFKIVAENNFNQTVFLTILARNKAHTLPLFLECIEKLDYEKKLITVYINTNNNIDHTEDILEEWIVKHTSLYREIIYEKHSKTLHTNTNPHEWNVHRFRVLSEIRDKSLRLAQEKNVDFYFVVDCDNFIKPWTLKTLIMENKPIIAPLLTSIPEKDDYYSNFFCAVDEYGYYKHHEDYNKILCRQMIDTFEVPVVHCTYLIQSCYLPLLSYQDGTDDYEFVIFSRSARKNNIKQYITNKKEFGNLVHFFDNVTLAEEVKNVSLFLKTINFLL